MALVIKQGTLPGEVGILVERQRGGTYARLDALVQALSLMTPGRGLVLTPRAIVCGPDAATRPGPQTLWSLEPGRFEVDLEDGGLVDDLVALIRGVLEDGTAGTPADDWIVEMSPQGVTLSLTDPAVLEDEPEPSRTGLLSVSGVVDSLRRGEPVTLIRTDYPLRDRALPRPPRNGPKRVKIRKRPGRRSA